MFASCATEKDITQPQQVQPVAPPMETPKGATTPEELISNYKTALAKKDAAAAIACFSKSFLRENADGFRNMIEDDDEMLAAWGMTKSDLDLPDNKLFEKIFAITLKKSNYAPDPMEKMKIFEVMLDGDKGKVIAIITEIADTGRVETMELEISIVRESGAWKIDIFNETNISSTYSETERTPRPPTESKTAVHEGTAFGSMSAIRSAESMHKAKFKKYGSMRELFEAEFLHDYDLLSGKKDGYAYEITATANTYSVTATPDDAKTEPAYRMAENGVIEIKRPGDDDFRATETGK
jgi:hypothetical protein